MCSVVLLYTNIIKAARLVGADKAEAISVFPFCSCSNVCCFSIALVQLPSSVFIRLESQKHLFSVVATCTATKKASSPIVNLGSKEGARPFNLS